MFIFHLLIHQYETKLFPQLHIFVPFSCWHCGKKLLGKEIVIVVLHSYCLVIVCFTGDSIGSHKNHVVLIKNCMEVLQIKFGIKSKYFDMHIFQVKFVTEKYESGKGVIRVFTRPLPLPDPLGLPAPYPILPLPEWGLEQTPPQQGVQYRL